ncbi:hypothetical protein DL98DRAFT_56393 [Cadophora sp. DSE1049]|nr:hypothetical protein DL98DRAFT_56393 [Cadophora sp. DSE1049]
MFWVTAVAFGLFVAPHSGERGSASLQVATEGTRRQPGLETTNLGLEIASFARAFIKIKIKFSPFPSHRRSIFRSQTSSPLLCTSSSLTPQSHSDSHQLNNH